MKFYNLLALFILSATLWSCGDENSSKKNNYSIQISTEGDNIQAKKPFSIQLKGIEKDEIDSIQYSYAGKIFNTSTELTSNNISLEKPLGRNQLSATIYSDGNKTTIEKEIILHAATSPKVFSYNIVNTYPHDPSAFTQGLEFYKDTLYEGTGRNGESSLRKIDYKTGKVLKQINLEDRYFGEGITILNDKIYQLTWQSNKGFIYDVNTLEKLQSFAYANSKEGWGLCNNGKNLYKSDGTEKIWILDPETIQEQGYIQPVTHKSLSTKFNELEWVNGKIYANTWQKDGIAIINPESGAIEGLIDFRGLRKELGNNSLLDNRDDVLNGIAYNKKTQKLYVTGKHWDKLFEVEIVEK